MYSAEDIQARLRAKPFRPLRIIASEGLRFEVQHPDLVLAGRRDLIVGHPTPDNPSVYDQVTRIALVHVVALEDIVVPAGPDNGQH